MTTGNTADRRIGLNSHPAASQQAKKVLDENMSVSTALPWISVYDEGDKTILAALKPTALMAMFNAPHLAGVAQEVEDSIVKIMKEAAS